MGIMINPRGDFEGIKLGDKRLTERLLNSIERMTRKAQESALGSGEGRTEAKGFYRLMSNEKFDLSKLQPKEADATIERIKGQDTVLLIQDTSDINLNTHKKTANLGYCSEYIRGIKAHSCIALTTEGLPLGLLGQSYETRTEPKSDKSAYEKAKRPIEEKESFRWVEMLERTTAMIPEATTAISITDREGDFFELYAKFSQLDEKYIIRIIHNRETSDGEKMIDTLKNMPACGVFTVNIPRDTRSNKPARKTEMEVAYCNTEMLKPIIRKEAYLPAAFRHYPSDKVYGLKAIWKGLFVLWTVLNYRDYVGQV
jgi:hypothetical protein